MLILYETSLGLDKLSKIVILNKNGIFEHLACIILVIWPRSFYQTAVNCLTMGESGPTVFYFIIKTGAVLNTPKGKTGFLKGTE